MITEEALPTYMAMLNTLDGVRDETGASPTPWGRWTRRARVQLVCASVWRWGGGGGNASAEGRRKKRARGQ